MGSRGLAVGGGAVVMAMDKVRDRAKAIAAHLLEAAAEDIEIVEGAFRVRGVPDRGVSLEEIAEKAYSDELPAEFGAGLEATEYFRPDDETFPFGTHVAVVEVLPDTGEVKLVKFVTVDDCGVIISPTLVRGQVHGGVAQGIGQALLEEIVYDASGELVTGTLNDYAIPRAVDFPPFETHHTETRDLLEPARGEGDRRGGDDRVDAGGGERGDRRTRAVGHHAPRRAVHAGACVAGDSGREHGERPRPIERRAIG